MNKNVIAALALALPVAAFAQSHTAEARPQFNSKPQVAAEAAKANKKPGVAPINDGSSPDGMGSGVKKSYSAAETAGQKRRDMREAQPHTEGTQGGTPNN